MKFSDFGLSDQVLRAVGDAGYVVPTPVQEQAIPHILTGRDILACAQTGTGKTASFTLPMIDILAAGRSKARMPRSLILEPTRELAAQVAEDFADYGKYHKLVKELIIGGESMADQLRAIERGVDVLIATPGRLLDVFERGGVLLADVRILVIDEADRMLDMGFIPDVERIVSFMPRIRQTLLLSATMPKEIRRLADAFLINPKVITVTPSATPAETVTQGLIMVKSDARSDPRSSNLGGHKEKRASLRAVLSREAVTSALIFCNRKRDVGVLYRSLFRHGFDAAQLHGDMAQPARTATLKRFKNGEVKLLVCSDVAARGLDIEGMSHVFNFDVPTHAEHYVHRIGRTGRAGREGRAFTFATPEDAKYVSAITALIGRPIPPVTVEGEVEREPQLAGEAGGEFERDRAHSPRGERHGRRRRRRVDEPRSEAPAPSPSEKPEAGKPARQAHVVDRETGKPARQAHVVDRESGKPARQAPVVDRESGKPARQAPVIGMGDHVPAFMRGPLEKPPEGSRQPGKGGRKRQT
ncbi:MAG TPA: DEAD/DEAH box helicase [Rhodospirillales bacterium]|nr:DEAD/DEAH box helicase [Rhodospirillales bacterium]HJO68577.1 DEAD/DEAH box helicase [Rhodospirillales bacterium]